MQSASSSPTVEIAHRAANELGESVLWDAGREQLVWVDIQRGVLFRREDGGGAVREYQLPERVGSIGLRAGGGLVLRGLAEPEFAG
jgi:L-arabinonolactonase